MKQLIPYGIFAALLNTAAVIMFTDTLDMPRAAYQLPRLLIVGMSILSILMLFERALSMKKEQQKCEEVLETNDLEEVMQNTQCEAPLSAEEIKKRYIRIGVFVAMLVLYIGTIESLGYFISTPVFLSAVLIYLKSTSKRNAIIISIGFTGFVYALFVAFLNLPVPMGLMMFE